MDENTMDNQLGLKSLNNNSREMEADRLVRWKLQGEQRRATLGHLLNR